VGEVIESFAKDKKGSSAMPHKRNPIEWRKLDRLSPPVTGPTQRRHGTWLCGMSAIISHSSVERVIFPDSLF